MQKLTTAAAFAAAAFLAGAPGAQAVTNLVTNGNFQSFTASSPAGANSQLNNGSSSGNAHGADLAGWASAGYAFDFTQGSVAYTSGASCYESCGNLTLWGPTNNGVSSSTSGTSSPGNTTFTAVPGGSNFLAVDPVYQTPDTLSQTVTGLQSGGEYTLTFYYAGAEQYGFSGATTEGFNVALGGSTRSTATISNAAHGYTPWVQATFTFFATSASQVLSFTATGGPAGGDPPIALLADVSLTYAPEPATWAVMMAGLGGLMLAGRFWRRRSVPAVAA